MEELQQAWDMLVQAGPGAVAFGIGFALVLVFLPTAVAAFRRHRHLKVLAGLNLAVGSWSTAGWVALLVWACVDRLPDWFSRKHKVAVDDKAA